MCVCGGGGGVSKELKENEFFFLFTRGKKKNEITISSSNVKNSLSPSASSHPPSLPQTRYVYFPFLSSLTHSIYLFIIYLFDTVQRTIE